jgi:hypothetical protein
MLIVHQYFSEKLSYIIFMGWLNQYMGWKTRVWIPVGAEMTFFSLPPRPDQLRGPPSLHFSGYLQALSLEVMQFGHEADHSPTI